MTRKKYTISFDKAEKSEQTARKLLLSNSDSVRLTEVHSTESGFFKIKRMGGEKDKRFIETLEKLEPFFIKKSQITKNSMMSNKVKMPNSITIFTSSLQN